MKRIFASLLAAAGTILPVMWWNATLDGERFCVGDAYVRETVDGLGAPVSLEFAKLPRAGLCRLVRDFPRPA
jgi:hypothetical protein